MLTITVLALLAASGSGPTAAAPRRCDPPAVSFARPAPVKTRPRALGDEPPANQYFAVERHVGGCSAPAVVRSGIGGRR